MSDSSNAAARVKALLPSRKGHFRLESGHHGALWLDLEKLCYDVAPVRELAFELAKRVESHDIDAVCGPLVEGAYVALFVAEALGVPFLYSTREEGRNENGLYTFQYRVPGALHGAAGGKRIAIVNDVINAGSAVLGTLEHLEALRATVPVMASLAVLGERAGAFCEERGVLLETLVTIPNEIYRACDCPLCAEGIPVTNN
ncbi:MAG: orotate phosphoribosyltransferase [Gemmatimonadetes bacterium]|nr:orotate phosphoribosyltransferase [Gemmatimonadota bacterium]